MSQAVVDALNQLDATENRMRPGRRLSREEVRAILAALDRGVSQNRIAKCLKGPLPVNESQSIMYALGQFFVENQEDWTWI